MDEFWATCQDFPEYEVSRSWQLRRKSDKKHIETFWWDGDERYALKDRFGYFRFVPFHEAWASVKFPPLENSWANLNFSDILGDLTSYSRKTYHV